MKVKKLEEKIEIPKEVSLEIVNSLLKLKGPKGEVEREFKNPRIKISKENNFLILTTTDSSKREKKMLNTFTAHIKNLIKGVISGFAYQLKICAGHFPMNIAVENGFVVVTNFLGEKIPRKAKISPGVDVKVEGDIVTVEGCDKEAAGKTASLIEETTKIKNRDLRVFQDGIFIISKAGKRIK